MKIKDWILKDSMQKLAYWILFNILYIFCCSYFDTTNRISTRIFSIGYIILLIINIIIGLTAFLKKKFKIEPINIAMLCAVVFGIISTIFAKNPILALLGTEERCEGLLSILYYFSLMLISGFLDKKYHKTIILIIIGTGIIQCIYAILQVHNVPMIEKKYDISDYSFEEGSGVVLFSGEIWGSGFISNPNFFGTYMLLCLSYVIGFIFENENKKSKIIYFAIFLLFAYGVLISKATSCALGSIVVMIYTFLYSLKNRKIKEFVILLALCGCIIGFSIFENKTNVINDLETTGTETAEIIKGNSKDTYGTKRIFIWKNTLKIVPKYLIHGVGIDNYILAFDDSYLKHPTKDIIYDKAHNEYLHILVTEGIFSLISYLAMYALICVKGIKNSFNNKELYCILPIIGYLVQAFFNIRVIEVAPIFFISMGLIISNRKRS